MPWKFSFSDIKSSWTKNTQCCLKCSPVSSSRGAHERSNIFPICRVLLMRCVCLIKMWSAVNVKCAILNSRRGLMTPHRGVTISYQRSFITDKSSGVKSRTSKTNYLASMTAFWKLQLRWNTTEHTQRHNICKMNPNDKTPRYSLHLRTMLVAQDMQTGWVLVSTHEEYSVTLELTVRHCSMQNKDST